MEPIHRFIQLYRRMRLVIYRRLLRRTGQLSAADAFAADIIYLLEQPTLTQFAGEMGISQPSASYRVNELAQKGVVEKVISPRDRRECRLRVGAEYRKKTLDAPGRDGEADPAIYPAGAGNHRRRAGCLPHGTGSRGGTD